MHRHGAATPAYTIPTRIVLISYIHQYLVVSLAVCNIASTGGYTDLAQWLLTAHPVSARHMRAPTPASCTRPQGN